MRDAQVRHLPVVNDMDHLIRCMLCASICQLYACSTHAHHSCSTVECRSHDPASRAPATARGRHLCTIGSLRRVSPGSVWLLRERTSVGLPAVFGFRRALLRWSAVLQL